MASHAHRLPLFLPDFRRCLAGGRGDHLVERRSMSEADQQGNGFDLERCLLEKPHGFACPQVAPISMNRHADVFAEAPSKCPGVDVELAGKADDGQRLCPVRRNPPASLFMNRALNQVAPALDERAISLLKESARVARCDGRRVASIGGRARGPRRLRPNAPATCRAARRLRARARGARVFREGFARTAAIVQTPEGDASRPRGRPAWHDRQGRGTH